MNMVKAQIAKLEALLARDYLSKQQETLIRNEIERLTHA